MHEQNIARLISALCFALLTVSLVSCSDAEKIEKTRSALEDEEVENLVRRSYQYVAMYNVNNKLAILLDVQLGGSLPGAEAISQIAVQPASLIGMLLMGLADRRY